MGLLHLRAELHPNWKGDNVGYNALHGWIRRHLLKPELCQECNKVPPYDLANVSGKYLRDLTDWRYLCRKCHMITDQRMDKIHLGNIHMIDMSDRVCSVCNNRKAAPNSNGRPHWYQSNNQLICSKCYQRERRHRIKKEGFISLDETVTKN